MQKGATVLDMISRQGAFSIDFLTPSRLLNMHKLLQYTLDILWTCSLGFAKDHRVCNRCRDLMVRVIVILVDFAEELRSSLLRTDQSWRPVTCKQEDLQASGKSGKYRCVRD